MLRTMIGLGLTLILLLGYAVYSNTVDSEYYRLETSNEEITIELTSSDDGTLFSLRIPQSPGSMCPWKIYQMMQP